MTTRRHHRTLAAELHEWSDEQLATLLQLRPDLVRHRPPASIDELGIRAQDQSSITRALPDLQLPANRLLQIVVCLRADAPLDELARALPDGVTLDDVEPVLRDLEARALLWRHDGRLHWSGGLVMAMPTTLGPPLRRLIDNQSVDYLVHAIAMLREDIPPTFDAELPRPAGDGRRGKPLKADLIDELETLLAVPGLIDAVVAAQEPAARDLARDLATGRPYRTLKIDLYYTTYGGSNYYAKYPEYQLYERGLFLPARNDGVGYLPREVGVALRGGHPVPDLALEAPHLVVTSVDPALVDEHAGAAAATTLHRLADLLARWREAPAKALKSGGLGVTVMKAAAAALDIEVEQANLAAELLLLGGLLAEQTVSRKEKRQITFDALIGPSPPAAAWVERDPQVQWRQLAAAWRDADHWPSETGRKDPDAKAVPVLSAYPTAGAAAIRRSILQVLLELQPGQATSRDALIDVVRWRWPHLVSGTAGDPRARIGGVVTEAETLGIIADGSLSTFGRALIERRAAAAERALAAHLPAAGSTFTLQADLTAMAVGALERAVLIELRLLADVESTGAATTFRFSETSLRRAIDAGRDPQQIHAFLEQHAAKGVPKTLTFLVDDVARRHGHLQVGRASSFVVSADPAVLADAVSHRKSRKLKLRLLAPTVAVSPLAPPALIDGLREAGFFPTRDGEHGDEVVLTPLDDDWHVRQTMAGGHRQDRPADARDLPQPFLARPLPKHLQLAPLDPEEVTAAVVALRAAPDRTVGPPPTTRPRVPPRTTITDAGRLDVDDDKLAAILQDAADNQLVLAVEIDIAGVVEALVILPVLVQPPVVAALRLPEGHEITLQLADIMQSVVVGEARQMLSSGPNRSRSRRRR